MLTELSKYQILEYQLIYPSSKVQFFLSFLLRISFYFYHHYFYIQYDYYSRNYFLFNNLLLQKGSYYLSLVILSFLLFFFNVLIMFYWYCFCVFGYFVLSFFPVPYTACLGVSVLKRLPILSLKQLTVFLIGSEI